MKKYPSLFICLMLLSICAAETPASDILDDSKNWPPKVSLTERYENESGSVLPRGREGVLIRLQEDKPRVAVVDFGREGVLEIPVNSTDILIRAEQISSGAITKEYANWTMMLGRAFLSIDPPGSRVRLSELQSFENFLIVYTTDVDERLRSLLKRLQAQERLLAETSTAIVLFPLSENPTEPRQYAQEIAEFEPTVTVFFMMPFLARHYVKSLHHEVGSEANVLVDVNGATLAIDRQPDAIDQLKARLENIANATR